MKNIVYFLISIITFSCETLVNDIDPDKFGVNKPRLVINSYISPNDSLLTAKLHYSSPVFSVRPANQGFGFQNISEDSVETEAKVEIYSLTQKMVLKYDKNLRIYTVKKADFKINAGEKYFLKVTDKSNTVYTAETIIPPLVNASLESFSEIAPGFNSSNNEYVNKNLQLTVKVNFPPNTYASLSHISEYDSYNGLNVKSSKVSSARRLYFNDLENQNESAKEKVLSTNLYINYNKKLHSNFKDFFKIYSLDKNIFDYKKSVYSSSDSDNPFVEPTLVKSNISGALGCFGSFNYKIVSINIKY